MNPTSTQPTKQALFGQLIEKVLDKRPILREILRKRGGKNLFEYAKEYISVNINPPIQKRQDELISAVESEVGRLLGSEVADSVAKQLASYYYVSTADHHGPICSPFFLNSNLMASAPYIDYPDPVLNNVIVLACANVSLNNSSFPRGLLFNSYAKGEMALHRLSFLPSNSHSSAVYNFRAYTAEEIKKIKSSLKDKVASGDVLFGEAEKIVSLIDDIYNREDILACNTYSDQITKTNFELWKKYFPANLTDRPNLIYLEQEGLVVKLLLDNHLFKDTAINKFIFDPTLHGLIDKYFDGIMGAFSLANKTGTFLFWGVSKDKNYRVQLWRDGQYLVSSDGSFRLELTPEEIKRALLEKQIIPSMILIFVVLCFYYGLKCLGGFSQVNYLTFMKNAYIYMCVERGAYRSIEVCARAQTKELGGDLTIAYLGGPKGELVPATGLDLVLYGDENTWQTIVDVSKQISLEEALSPMMPEFYKIIYPENEREHELAEITGEDVTKLIKLDEKIKACAFIKTNEKN